MDRLFFVQKRTYVKAYVKVIFTFLNGCEGCVKYPRKGC